MTEKRAKIAPGVIPAKAEVRANACKRGKRMRYARGEGTCRRVIGREWSSLFTRKSAEGE